MMNVLVTGSLGFDYIMDFPGKFTDRIMPDRIHNISLSFLVDKLSKQFGGTAGNIGYSLKLLQTEPTILAVGGNDFGPYQDFLAKHKIDTSKIKIVDDISTGSYFVITDKEDNQIGSFFAGAIKYATDLSIADFTSLDFVIIAPNDPKAMKKYVEECQENNLKFLYDPAFQIENFSAGELSGAIDGAEIFIGNDYEIALVEKKLEISHVKLLSKCPIVITTLGSKGSIVESDGKQYVIGCARATKVVDPTGAGDAYRAGFLAGYVRKFPLEVCGKMGSVAAVFAVEEYGTVNHYYSPEEFFKRYRENFGEEISL